MDAVKFVRMKDGDTEDYAFLREKEISFAHGTADRVLAMLSALQNSMGGYRVSRLTHSTQAATRAWRDGADIDWVVSTLLHDIGDELAPYNHSDLAAAILRPFVRRQCYWTVKVHGAFQMVYYADKLDQDPNARDRFTGHPFFDDCVEFCERWDQESFDPQYETLPLEFFRPMVRDVFRRTPFAPERADSDHREPLRNPAVANTRTGN